MCPAQFATPRVADEEHAARRAPQPAPETVRRAAAPLVVGAADDRAEVEADRVADEVITRLQGQEGAGHVHDGCHGQEQAVARSAAPASGAAEVGYDGGAISDDLSSRIQGRRGGGTALDGDVRARMESGFGRSLGDVRIHTDGESAQLNRSISARAFTTGKDIFFGQGEYQPGTAAGDRVLAHELAHTQQQGGGAHRVHRLWDLDAPAIPWDQTRKVSTVSSGQSVFFLSDSSGDKIVVKAEDKEVGLSELSSFIHVKMSDVKSVRHRKLTTSDKTRSIGLVLDQSLMDRESWAKLGREKKADFKTKWAIKELEQKHGLPPGTGVDQLDDAEVGHYVHEQILTHAAPSTMVAMSYAAGETAAGAGKRKDPNQMKPEKNRMRSLMQDWKHLEHLGKLTAVDLFLGNKDRIIAGNLGNWIYDPHSAAMTAIDHVDSNVSAVFRKKETDVDNLAKKNLGATAKDCVDGIAQGMRIFADDADFGTWLDSEGGYRRKVMEEAIERGLLVGRELVVKTFTATRFSRSKAGKQARAVKKSIKQSARTAVAVDQEDGATDQDAYYKLLKSRAEWLKKN